MLLLLTDMSFVSFSYSCKQPGGMEFQKRVVFFYFSDKISKPDIVYVLSVISAKFEKLVDGYWQFSILNVTLNI